MLLKRFGKFGRVLWERSQGIDERSVSSERLRKSVGVERTLMEDIHDWSECEFIITGQLYPELEAPGEGETRPADCPPGDQTQIQ
jgi:DNA polymerase-4